MFDLPFISKIEKAGGRCYLVGGAVIAYIQNSPIKDWDIEVHGLGYQLLSDILCEFGDANLVGQSFGVIKMAIDGIEFDFSIPRKENRVGGGHKDFECELLPDLSPKEAARRRDLTINSIYLDLHVMNLVDPYNGQKDLEDGVIRATNPETFREDPLRVLRIMQILARKGVTVEPETLALCRAMADEMAALSKERIFEEWKKLLLMADKPSIGLEFLKDSGWLKWFPELEELIGCPQSPVYHPEGDVWKHTLMAVDAAAQQREFIPDDWKLAYMFGMLLHDIGKPTTTDPVTFTAYGHDTEGAKIAAPFMERLTNDKKLIQNVCQIVKLHMRPGHLVRDEAGIAAWKRLQNELRLDIMAYVSLADGMATGGLSGVEKQKPAEIALDYFSSFGETKIEPVLKGRHLIKAGYKPGPHFAGILKKAYEYQIETGCEEIHVLLEIVTNSHSSN